MSPNLGPNELIEIMRAKLDAAIVAEQWDAVKAISARIRELENAGTIDLDAERKKRGGK